MLLSMFLLLLMGGGEMKILDSFKNKVICLVAQVRIYVPSF